jgi:hypothetical protein
MALPVTKNLAIYKGDTYKFSFRLKEQSGAQNYVDLTGCTAKAEIRPDHDSETVLVEFTTEVPTQTGDDLGRVNLSLTPTETSAAASGVWDVQLTWPDGMVKTYLAESVVVTKEVTRV